MQTPRETPGRAPVPTRRWSRWVVLGLVLALVASACRESPEPASDGPIRPEGVPAVLPIVAEDLPLRDEYWPQKVRLTTEWTPESGERVRPVGVLLRVESPAFAWVDFGRQGIHEVPIGVTDLVERANELREQGPDAKIGNVTRMVGGALGDPTFEEWRPYLRSRAADRDLLLVAAPLDPALLQEMAEPLARLDAMDGVRVILLAQGETTTEEILRVLHEIGWTTPFLRQRYVRATTHGYLGEDLALPWLGLLTPNGRVLYRGPWLPDGDPQPVLDALAERERERDSRALPTAGGAAARSAG